MPVVASVTILSTSCRYDAVMPRFFSAARLRGVMLGVAETVRNPLCRFSTFVVHNTVVFTSWFSTFGLDEKTNKPAAIPQRICPKAEFAAYVYAWTKQRHSEYAPKSKIKVSLGTTPVNIPIGQIRH